VAELRIVMAQLNPLVGDVEGNTDKVVEAALRARDRYGADAILFPELMLSGYPPGLSAAGHRRALQRRLPDTGWQGGCHLSQAASAQLQRV